MIDLSRPLDRGKNRRFEGPKYDGVTKMARKFSLWQRVRKRLKAGNEPPISPMSSQRIRLSGKRFAVPIQGIPLQVEMGDQRLHIYPEQTLIPELRQEYGAFILFDPERYYAGISHFLRLAPGEKLSINHRARDQKYVFSRPKEAFRRHLQLKHTGDTLVFKDPISELGTYLSVLWDEQDISRIERHRLQALRRVCAIYGQSLEPLAPKEALETLKEVNRLLKNDAYRREDSYGNPGGILDLPARLTPIVVGDLHGQVDNLVKILTENAYLESLEKGEAALIILGDAVHREDPGQLENMDSSILMMDLILKLKLRFPSQVFFIIGNHDCFSLDCMKAGVPQGLLWGKRVTELRGEEYKEALAEFYQRSPVLVRTKGFIACHAGPTHSKVSEEMLVDVRQYPGLVREITSTRAKSPASPAGYTGGDVRRFRKALGVDEEAAFVVGHFPRSADLTVWLDIEQIRNHHVVYSARKDQVGVFTRIDGYMVPQVYPAESLITWANKQHWHHRPASIVSVLSSKRRDQ